MSKFSKSVSILLALIMLLTVAVPAFAGRADDSDRKSKNGKTEGSIDGVTVVLEYGRPEVRGRDIWGGLVPYGEVWRTGADEATTIHFSADVTVQGKALEAGTYSLFTVPGEEGWSVIFNTVAEQWGAYKRDAGKDALKVDAKAKSHEHVEAMDFVIEGNDVVLRWAETAVPFTVTKAE